MSTEPIKNIEDIPRDASDEEIMAWCLSKRNGAAVTAVTNELFKTTRFFIRSDDDMRDEIRWTNDIFVGKRDDDTCRRIYNRWVEELLLGNKEAALELSAELHNVYLYEREMNGGRPYWKGNWK